MVERERFLKCLNDNLFSDEAMFRLYGLINFNKWKPSSLSLCSSDCSHVKIKEFDRELIYSYVKEYYSDKTVRKCVQIQCIKKAIKLIPEIKLLVNLESNSECSKYTEFVIFGCDSSTDIDVACMVRECDQSNGETKRLADSEIIRLGNELEELGYDIKKGIDISEIYVDSYGNVISISKGSKEIQNIIYHTYNLHKQKYKCPVKSTIDVELWDKVRGLSKFLLDNLYDLANISEKSCVHETNLKKYTKSELSSIKKETYFGGSTKIIQFAKEITKYVNLKKLGSDSSDGNLLSIAKSIVMKYIQLILLVNDEYSYVKVEMSLKISKYIPDSTDNAMYFLFRGTRGTFCENFILKLHENFVKIVEEISFMPIMSTIDISSIINPTTLEDKIFTEFMKSPIYFTEEFEKLWEEKYKDVGLNSLFVSKASDCDELFTIKNKDKNIIVEEDKERFLFVNPRSSEWLNLLTIYKCGTNSKIISDSIESKYNLIRGSIGEIIISEYLNLELLGLSTMKKITIGMIVQDIKHGSRGCCPDLILASNEEIIPVEIKCLKTLSKNKDYYRAINLAKKQCIGTIELLGKNYSYLIQRYLVIILGWSEYTIEHIFFNI
jgi:hypothetical protein